MSTPIIMLPALLIFISTLVLVLWQPRGLSIGWSAAVGALLALLAGVIGWQDVQTVGSMVWNATMAVIATVIISMILDALGFFEWAALHLAKAAKGNGVLLFLSTLLLGALVAAFFNNDGAALIVTPIVLAMVRALGMDERVVIAYVLASGFIADATSIPLVISNLVNMIAADSFGLTFSEYAVRMAVPNLVSLIASACMLLLVFGKWLPKTYDHQQLRMPGEAVKDRKMFRLVWILLILLLAGYWIGEWYGIPVSAVAWGVAIVMLAASRRSPWIRTREVLGRAPWAVIVFSLGMYLIVFGLKNAGLTSGLSALIEWLGRQHEWIAVTGMGFLAALMSAVMNNLPAVMMNSIAIAQSPLQGDIRELMIYANVIGCDLGPKMTPVGSLATLIWLHVLALKGLRISWGLFCRTGMMLTVPVLFTVLSSWYLWYLFLK